jgi:hypothetical protein
MPIRPSSTRLAADRDLNSTEDLPLSLLLFRYLWPFWLFKDASRGDRMARAAAYRHNRGMRIYLPGYLLKWVISCGIALLMIFGFESLSDRRGPDVFIVMAAAMGIAFACGVCVLLMTGYVYLYLSSQDY